MSVTVVNHVRIKLSDEVHLSAKLWLPTWKAHSQVKGEESVHTATVYIDCSIFHNNSSTNNNSGESTGRNSRSRPSSRESPYAELEKGLRSNPHRVGVGCVLEIIPYGHAVWSVERDRRLHYFAQCGFAVVRVDLRGSGESEGVLLDEYLPRELLDCCEVLQWIAKQSWSNGRVAMYGKSWGGFNGLQVAAMQPKELKCVVSVYSTDSRFTDDIHYQVRHEGVGESFAPCMHARACTYSHMKFTRRS
eukprot:TRINITY_DN15704_c0_g1_i1.p1 TRINITY_DN15704_c0_g1~~TRINITY_DN15704_c0_g1_i1.p1  ORF type:complete len:247 (+),score=13.89 TRINITY_DN15704_c0_g1_i1:42-782(+)